MKKNLIAINLEKIFIKNFKVKKSQLSSLSIGNFYKWDSLSHIKLMMDVEKKYKISINHSTRVSLTSFNKLKDYLIKIFIK